MGGRQIILLFAGFIFVIIFFNIPTYKGWLDKRILVFTKEIHEEIGNMDLEARRVYRLQGPYTGVLSIKENAKLLKIDSPLVLFPPNEYCQKMMPGLVLPEPVVCYYFAGLRATTINSNDVYNANCGIVFENGQFILAPLYNKEQIDRVIGIYKATK